MSRLRTESRTFGELEVTTRQLVPTKALVLVPRVLDLLASLISNGLVKGATSKLDLATIGPALAAISRVMSGSDLLSFVKDVCAGTTVKGDFGDGKGMRILTIGDDTSINAAFGGNFGKLFEVTAFALEVTFGDFFDGANAPVSGET